MTTNQSTSSLPGERVLVVDDSRQIRDFLADYILKPRGYEVLTASDGLKGLRLAFDEHPDLMIVDVQMPNMDGFELLRRVQLRRLNIPTILITAHGSETVAVEALRLGVRDYVLKPFDVEDMEAAIERAMRESRLAGARDELEQQLARQNGRLRHLAQQIGALYSLGNLLTNTDTLDERLQRVVEAAAYLTSANQSAIFLLDDRREELSLRAHLNMPLAHQLLSLKTGPAAHVLRTGEMTILGEKNIPRVLPGATMHNLAYVPLRAGAQPLGVLNVATNRLGHTFSQGDCSLLAILASMTALAVQNAALQQRLAHS